VFDAVGDVIREGTERVVSVLMQAFHGPFLVASHAHTDDMCPFRHTAVLPITTVTVDSPYVLPAPESLVFSEPLESAQQKLELRSV
jgi:hypothetical protein